MNFQHFAEALLHPAAPCPPGLRTFDGSDPAARFAVHRNNVVASLVAALAETFEVTRRLVGDDFFGAMARQFVCAHPPRSPVLADYGDAFAPFIAGFAPAAPLPYLPDMARLERARVRACHAADAAPLAGEAIAALITDPAALAASRPALHPSLQLVVSDFGVVSLWAAHQGQGDIAQVDAFAAEAALVLRDDDGDVAVVPVPLASARFFGHLLEGATLAQAAAAQAPFDLAGSLAILIRHRAITAWRTSLEACA